MWKQKKNSARNILLLNIRKQCVCICVCYLYSETTIAFNYIYVEYVVMVSSILPDPHVIECVGLYMMLLGYTRANTYFNCTNGHFNRLSRCTTGRQHRIVILQRNKLKHPFSCVEVPFSFVEVITPPLVAVARVNKGGVGEAHTGPS